MKKITKRAYNHFLKHWNENAFPQQRFGQAVLNMFYPRAKDPILFYEGRLWKAKEIIETKYVGEGSK